MYHDALDRIQEQSAQRDYVQRRKAEILRKWRVDELGFGGTLNELVALGIPMDNAVKMIVDESFRKERLDKPETDHT